MNSINNYDNFNKTQNEYRDEYYNSYEDETSFVEKIKKMFQNGNIEVRRDALKSWIREHFENESVCASILLCFETDERNEWASFKENTIHWINKTLRCGRLQREAWSMVNTIDDTQEKKNRFMAYWKYAFCKYERDSERHHGLPVMVLFKRALEIYKRTGFAFGCYSYRFLSMTHDINILCHRAQIIDQSGLKFESFMANRYFSELSRRTFLSLPRFHQWLRGATDLHKFVKGLCNIREKDIRLLGQVSPRCREYVIKRLKETYDFNSFYEIEKGFIESLILEWQKKPRFYRRIPDIPGKHQWISILKCFKEETYRVEYPKVDLKSLVVDGSFKEFLRTLPKDCEEETVSAAKDLFQAMGHQAVPYLERWYGKNNQGIHDAGQAFSGIKKVLSKTWQDFILRYGPEASALCRFSDRIERPVSLNSLRSQVAKIAYGGSAPEDVQKACYECKLTEEQYLEYCKWLENNNNKTFETCPYIDLTIEGYRFVKLESNDVRGPLLGLYTNCCQHPNGAGSDCARHGWTSGYGAFYVVEHKGKIVGQSWAWRGGENLSTLCFDNIELLSNAYGPVVLKLYTEVSKRFLGVLGIERVTVGLGYNDLEEVETLKDDRKGVSPCDYNGYRDSRSQKILYSMLEE